LIREFLNTGDLAHISKAVSTLRRSVELTPAGHVDTTYRFNSLGVAYWFRSQRTGNLPDLSEAILHSQRSAVEMTAEGHSALPSWLNNLGNAFQTRFRCTGDLLDLAEAISVRRRAATLTPNIPSRLSDLSFSLECQFRRTGDPCNLSEAISTQQTAVELTPEGHPSMPSRVTNLGNLFWFRFQCTGGLSDITKAVSLHQSAVDLTPEGHQDLPYRLANLGASLESHFQHTGNSGDLGQAISANRKAVELAPDGDSDLPTYLNNLGNSLEARFTRKGDLQVLAESILSKRKAVELTPEGHTDLPSWLSNLGNSLQSRFQRTDDLSDLAEAILTKRKALELTPEGHPQLPSHLNNLGNSLESFFERTGDINDSTEAISAKRRALELTPVGHSEMPSRFGSLGVSFESRFARTGDPSDLSEAISAKRRAVELTPEGHPQMTLQLNNLGVSLESRFRVNKDPHDLAEAISVKWRAVNLSPEGHPDTPSCLTLLGVSFQSLFQRTGDNDDLAKAISHFKSSATSTYGPPHIRLNGAKCWALSLKISYPSSPEILNAFDTTIHLIALTASLDQTLRNRFTQLQSTSGLPLQAAATAFAFDRIDKALEWLEQGRGLVWGQLTNLRTPLDDLREHDSQLASSITKVGKQLEGAGSSRASSRADMSLSERVSLEDEALTHVMLAQQWDNLIARARTIPGFEAFLKPAPWSTLLQNLPGSGPIVLINLDHRRCDAIALLAGYDRPLHIPLPNFTLELCQKYREDLGGQLRSHQLRDRGGEETSGDWDGERGIRPVSKASGSVVQGILRGLWEKIAKPILRRLEKANKSSATPLPRIWWCPTGPLSFLPIHAAGIYGNAESESVLDYAVSSYTPTVAAITARVRDGRSIETNASGLLMTSQPNAPGVSSIPGTTTEVQAIYNLTEKPIARVKKLEGGDVSVAKCLELMGTYSSVHFACHATQDAADPLKSRFLFHDGSLELATILKRDLKNADLAFLSACQTSTGEEKLSDEAVHLAAGMLAAGYRRVVATMWSIKDQHAPAVATDFYEYLLEHADPASSDGFDGTNSAHALHHAIQQLRLRLSDNSDEALLAWIPYVHFG
ncbi:CHAT domain-containing protein, partial [Ephemerocybe angulata]